MPSDASSDFVTTSEEEEEDNEDKSDYLSRLWPKKGGSLFGF